MAQGVRILFAIGQKSLQLLIIDAHCTPWRSVIKNRENLNGCTNWSIKSIKVAIIFLLWFFSKLIPKRIKNSIKLVNNQETNVDSTYLRLSRVGGWGGGGGGGDGGGGGGGGYWWGFVGG